MVAKNNKPVILVVDDEENYLKIYSTVLEAEDIGQIVCCSDSRKVLDVLAKNDVSLMLLDLIMPHLDGINLLEKVAELYPHISVIVATGTDETETAVSCMKKGAYDYLVKPISKKRLVTSVLQALRFQAVQKEAGKLKRYIVNDDLEHPETFNEIITGNRGIHSIFCYVEAVAPSPSPLLITGDTGTGKELFARAVHQASGRKGPFVAVNVAGLDDNILSDTLFGHRKGAFTGADIERAGMIESAAGGTLFLDEIGDMNMVSQIKLLRLLQEGEYFRLGEDFPRKTDARIVVATNQNLDKMRQDGAFRKDLYYRLCTHRIDLPPLRDRKEDIGLLLEHFIRVVCDQTGRKPVSVSRKVLNLLEAYSFPGNIRELEGMVYDAMLKYKSDRLEIDSFRDHIKRNGFDADVIQRVTEPLKGRSIIYGEELPALKNAKRILIEEALRRSGGNKSKAATLLQTSRQALNYWS